MLRTVEFVDETNAHHATGLHDQRSRKRMRAEMKMRDRVRSRQQCPADLPPGGIAMRVQNSRSAVRGFPRKRQLSAGAVEFGAPLDQLGDVLWALFRQQGHRFSAAEAIACFDGVLLVQAD